VSDPGRADALERRYLHDIFAELCRIESPSGREEACARRVTEELRALGIEIHEDGAAAAAGSDCGNLLARLPAGGARLPAEDAEAPGGGPGGERPCVLLCAHLDTVPLAASVEPVLCDGYWENANDGILGADNKAAVAVLLALARRSRRVGTGAGGWRGEGCEVDIELLFTVGEERALAGARAFDATRLRSGCGYVFDHSSPIGELVLAAPSLYRVQATFRGAAAHAGVRPEEGRSAILAAARAVADLRLGRLDEQTTANVGTIAGGSASNVVPERCTVVAEVRSRSEERAEEVVADVVDCVNEAANLPDCECDVDVEVQRMFRAYRLAPATPAVRAAEVALRSCGYEPVQISSGGASDASALIAGGLPTVNLANGSERNHEPGERISAVALEGMLDVALALPAALAAAGASSAAGAGGAAGASSAATAGTPAGTASVATAGMPAGVLRASAL
jgi:tripeptide aminopeptidase